jgi:hypothetical protein
MWRFNAPWDEEVPTATLSSQSTQQTLHTPKRPLDKLVLSNCQAHAQRDASTCSNANFYGGLGKILASNGIGISLPSGGVGISFSSIHLSTDSISRHLCHVLKFAKGSGLCRIHSWETTPTSALHTENDISFQSLGGSIWFAYWSIREVTQCNALWTFLSIWSMQLCGLSQLTEM